MRYPVTITPDNRRFSVTFPDVPGAVTFGDTREEALERAQDALLTVFDAYMKDRREIPEPSGATRSTEMIEIPALDFAKIELYRAMRDARVGKAELAKRLNWHLPQVDRVLKMKHGSQFAQMESAFAALGKRLVIAVEDEPQRTRPSAPARSGELIPSAKRRRASTKISRRSTVHAGVLMRPASDRATAHRHAVVARRVGAMRKAAKKR